MPASEWIRFWGYIAGRARAAVFTLQATGLRELRRSGDAALF